MSRVSLRVFGAAMFTTVCWASAFVGIRAGLAGYTPGDFALLRFSVASIVMWVLHVCLGRREKVSAGTMLQIALLGCLGFAFYNLMLNYGELHIPAGPASFIISQIPTFIILFSWVFLGEGMTRNKVLGLCVSIVGIGVIAWGNIQGPVDSELMKKGLGYVIAATLSGALYSTLQKPVLRKVSPLTFVTYGIWFGTAAMFCYLPHTIQAVIHAPLKPTLYAIYLGVFPAALAYLSWGYVLSKMPASRAANYLYSMPFISTWMAVPLLGEAPEWVSVTGGAIAIVGAVISSRGRS